VKKFRVEELAKERKITQEELTFRVRKLGVKVSLATIQGIWQGRDRRYRADTLFAIAEVLGVPIQDLYVGGEPSYTKDNAISPGHASAFQTA
jgi:transcriptional regulator with XRE-family HTH domain